MLESLPAAATPAVSASAATSAASTSASAASPTVSASTAAPAATTAASASPGTWRPGRRWGTTATAATTTAAAGATGAVKWEWVRTFQERNWNRGWLAGHDVCLGHCLCSWLPKMFSLCSSPSFLPSFRPWNELYNWSYTFNVLTSIRPLTWPSPLIYDKSLYTGFNTPRDTCRQ